MPSDSLNGSPDFVWAQQQVIQVGKWPQGVAVASIGTKARLFVTNTVDGTVSVFDAETLQPVGNPIPVSRMNGVTGIAASPGDGAGNVPVYVFVPAIVTAKDGSDEELFTVINAETLEIVQQTLAVGAPTWNVAVAPDNSYVFVACQAGAVNVIEAKTFQAVGQPIPAGTQPFGVAVTPDSARAYVADLDEPGGVTVIDVQSLTVAARLTGFDVPVSVCASTDDARVFVGNMAGSDAPVTWIDNTTDPPTVKGAVAPFYQPTALAASPDGAFVFVGVAASNQVAVFNPTTLEIVGAPIQVGTNPQGVAVSPDSRRVFVANHDDNTVSVIERVPIQTTPLLAYAIVPAPEPLTASFPGADLALIISNPGMTVVNCTQIIISLPVGVNAKDLTTDATGIQTFPPGGWEVAQQGGIFTLTPATPANGAIGAQGLEFLFTNIQVNSQPSAECPIVIDETAASYPQPSLVRTETFTLVKAEAGFTLSDLTANSLTVPSCGTATLQWSGSASTVTIPVTYTMIYNSGNESVSTTVGNSGPYTSEPLTQTPSVTFTLQAAVTLAGQTEPLIVQKQITVSVSSQ